jgi:hypothetical protein
MLRRANQKPRSRSISVFGVTGSSYPQNLSEVSIMVSKKVVRKVTCPKCDSEWSVVVTEEYGIQNLTDDNDLICKNCGCEGEIGIDEIPFGETLDREFTRLFPDLAERRAG